MDRRRFLHLPLGLMLCAAGPAAAAMRTQWRVRGSEGFDALCFLGPLSGDPFYARYYRDELAAFAPRFGPEVREALERLTASAKARGALLGPECCLLMSGGPDDSLEVLIGALDAAETRLLRPFRASPYWDEALWTWFVGQRDRLRQVLQALATAGFPAFRRGLIEAKTSHSAALSAALARADVVGEDERLLGRRFADPRLEAVLLYFSQPHGIRIQGQRFLTYLGYPPAIVLRNAAHEFLHPPFDPTSAEIAQVLTVLGRDPLVTRIVAGHDPSFGYNSLAGYLDEDCVQALEQIVNERLGTAIPARDRWLKSDNGMHVLAAALYGMMKADGYDRRGGRFQDWLHHAAAAGALAPARLAGAAAQVLGRPADQLWAKG